MDNNIFSGERVSFYSLFKDKSYKISVPILQRDYAQGRTSTEDVRTSFLIALYDYLYEAIPNRDLDFVYGTLLSDSEERLFIPLDGQQRLTTLFLLHWYLYQISTNEEKRALYINAIYKDSKSMFTYETRTSSSDFCDMLMGLNIDFENLLDSDKSTDNHDMANSLSKTIRNSPQYYLSWKYDPTITSMLTMLDSIHAIFKDKGDFFDLLIDTNNPIITFLFLNLQDFKLTDELYVKMNSRGKPLTAFENFKAKFEQHIDQLDCKKDYYLEFEGCIESVSLKKYFAHNIDTKWANTFWAYRKLSDKFADKKNTYDDELLTFIRVMLAYQYALGVNNSSRDNTLEYMLGTSVARQNARYSDLFSFAILDKLDVLTEKGIIHLIEALDVLSISGGKITEYLPEHYKFYYAENKIFEKILTHNISNQDRLCFFAYVGFLIQYNNQTTGLEQWMRVIHNLTHPENTIIDTANEVATALQSISKLLPYSNDIINHIVKIERPQQFSSWQFLEEKIKAHLIMRSDDWKNAIEKIEKHNYFNGQIGFILEFCGILDYFSINGDCLWDNDKNECYYNLFVDNAEKASAIFEGGYDNRINNKNFVFERAVLTKGDYLTKSSQDRRNLLSTNLVKNNIKRDHSWKRVLRINDAVHKNRLLLVKEVFDDERLDANDIQESLTAICIDRTNTWRDYFIECPELISYCNQGFIRFENDGTILLYGESQSNHLHAEMYTYYLWIKHIQDKYTSLNYNRVYQSSKSIDYLPNVYLCRFLYGSKSYEIRIFYIQGFFLEIEGYLISRISDPNLIAVLSELNFNEVNSTYSYFEQNIFCLITKIKELENVIRQIK